MALPADPAPSFYSQPDWIAEHSQRTHRNSPHGHKRRLDERDQDDVQPSTLPSEFKRLRIYKPLPNRPLHTPDHAHNDLSYSVNQQYPQHPLEAAPEEPVTTSLRPHAPLHHPTPSHAYPPSHLHPHPINCDTPPPKPLPTDQQDLMRLDNSDNPHRIVISDLDAEFAAIEADEQAKRQREQEVTFFLPEDLDKKLSAVPNHVLRGNSTSNSDRGGLKPPVVSPSQALVLYKSPPSLGLPQDEGEARRAVDEAKQRFRERQHSQPSQQPEDSIDVPFQLPPSALNFERSNAHQQQPAARYMQHYTPYHESGQNTPDFDPDGMDLD